MHARTQIRQAVIGRLNALPQFAGKVGGKLLHMPSAGFGTVIQVYPGADASEVSDMSGLRQQSFNLIVELLMESASASIEDAIDDACLAIEKELDGSTIINESGAHLVNTDISFDGDAGKPIGQAALQFNVDYMIRVGVPDVIL